MRGGSPLLLASAKAGHTSCIFERQVTKKADVQHHAVLGDQHIFLQPLDQNSQGPIIGQALA
jgi:hypothetical protein